jgi:hypothetical protein
MSTHQPKPNSEGRAYTKMVRAIDKERKRYRWIVPASCLAVVAGGLTYMVSQAQPWWRALTDAGNVVWAVFVGFLVLVLSRELLQHGDKVDKVIDVGLEHLREAQYNKPTLACIKERAQIASTASMLRTILPVVAVPIALGALLAQGVVAPEFRLPIWVAVAILVSSMVVDLLRGSTAFFVLDSLAEFQCEQDLKALPTTTEQPQTTARIVDKRDERKTLPSSSRRRHSSGTITARRKA